ncbi:MAG: alpha/beta hydrolase [Nostocaceae cyanobacterium]|nr:alpha/beta hydrolase [Nostocaceae cyanobacterium]
MSTDVLTPSTVGNIGGTVKEYIWHWENQQLRVVYETLGNGQPVLLLPAFSTVSTRQEMAGIAQILAANFQAVAVDWLGFGESSRPELDYRPALYQQFLEDLVTSIFNTKISVIAAGHSAAYVLQLAKKLPDVFAKIVLVAPTWRGPLPTMGANRQVADTVRETVRSRLLGQALYTLNTKPSFLKFMYRRHVFANEAHLTAEFIQQKWQTTQQPGARFGSAAFVTGTLDAVHNQDDFMALAQSLSTPLMVVIGESTPPKSRAEMDALTAISGVLSQVLPGSLGMHEEYPVSICEVVLPFLLALS